MACVHSYLSDVAGPFDLILAFHLCGGGTDEALDRALESNCSIVMCPCCVGKFRESVIERPRSKWLREAGISSEDFLSVLARLGDHSDNVHDEAKLLIELDRCAYVRERNEGYRCWITKIVPENATPRNDIVVMVSGSVAVEF